MAVPIDATEDAEARRFAAAGDVLTVSEWDT